MHPDVKRLIDWATANGWDDLGQSPGTSHYRLRHAASGTPLTLPSTPSDRRGIRNSWAFVARVTGKRPPREKAARYRHTGQRAPRFDMAAAVREQRRRQMDEELEQERERQRAERIEALHALHIACVQELHGIGDRVDRLERGTAERSRALRLIARCLDIEDEAERLGSPVVVPVKNI